MQPAEVPDEPKRTFTEVARRAQIVAAAIDTIAELGYGQASFARIAARIGISRGLISYHFTGKDELIREVVLAVHEQGRAYIGPRIVAQASSGSGFLRAYIEANFGFMREHRNHVLAMVEIALVSLADEGQPQFFSDADVDAAAEILEQHLARFQSTGELRADFNPGVMAVAIRGAIDAVPRRLARNPDLDLDTYANEMARTFHLATRCAQQ
jgi:TetR/AcrR family transcriptional regulator, fatty acid metabolism regulator protein